MDAARQIAPQGEGSDSPELLECFAAVREAVAAEVALRRANAAGIDAAQTIVLIGRVSKAYRWGRQALDAAVYAALAAGPRKPPAPMTKEQLAKWMELGIRMSRPLRVEDPDGARSAHDLEARPPGEHGTAAGPTS